MLEAVTTNLPAMYAELNVNAVLTTFEGKEMRWDESPDSPVFTLRDAILRYVRLAPAMGLNDQDQDVAYAIGMAVGSHPADSDQPLGLTKQQYRTLLRLVQNGKVKRPGSPDEYVWGIEVRIQAKNLVESAAGEDARR